MVKIVAFLFAAMLVAAGCALNGHDITGNPVSKVLYVHDDQHNVGCWYYVSGVYCIPDTEYTR